MSDPAAEKALRFIIPILKKYSFRWVITGGFAAYVYGVPRDITDIDIDIDTSEKLENFRKFYEELAPYRSQELEHFIDQNYDNYNFEITVDGQIIDICPMAEMNVIDKTSGVYKNFYANGFPDHQVVSWHGLDLPLLSKELIIKNKEMLVWQRDSDFRDINGLKKS